MLDVCHKNYAVDLRRRAGGRGAVTPAPQMEVPAVAVLRGWFQVPVPRSPLPDSVLHPQGMALKRHTFIRTARDASTPYVYILTF